jgi:hypothetical protein
MFLGDPGYAFDPQGTDLAEAAPSRISAWTG